jgi:DNA-binding NtrC family response regulator
MPTLLIIDDNPGIRTALRVLFELHEFDVQEASSPAEAIAQVKALGAGGIDAALQDMNFESDTTNGEEGVQLFHALRSVDADLPIVLLTAWTHLEHAVALVRAGAADYLQKPWQDDRLVTTVNNLIELRDAQRGQLRANQALRRQRTELSGLDLRGMVLASSEMIDLLRLAARVARSDISVLITGANGAGKERIAEILHHNSPVRGGPLVSLNCGAIPSELIEAELFGAEAGAYTGAGKAREGRFDAANGGTLFLDEIGNLPLAGQIKLLRVLETGQFERLGSNKTRQVKVRIICATNANLPAMIAAGSFREDLFYRLNVIELHVPALALRADDILPLARHFLAAGKSLSPQAERALLAHAWPGNVRELKNAITRAGLLAQNAVFTPADLGLTEAKASQTPTLLIEPTKADIEQAIERAEGVIADAASALGMTRQSLYRRMERFGIERISIERK